MNLYECEILKKGRYMYQVPVKDYMYLVHQLQKVMCTWYINSRRLYVPGTSTVNGYMYLVQLQKVICTYFNCRRLYVPGTSTVEGYMYLVHQLQKVICTWYINCRRLHVPSTSTVGGYMYLVHQLQKIICTWYINCRRLFPFTFLHLSTGSLKGQQM